MIKAAQRFDETRGFKFISYAVWWIRQSIFRLWQNNQELFDFPLNKIGSINKINKAFAQLEQEFEREPKPLEIAAYLEIPIEEVKESIKNHGRHVSMDAPLHSDEDNQYVRCPKK